MILRNCFVPLTYADLRPFPHFFWKYGLQCPICLHSNFHRKCHSDPSTPKFHVLLRVVEWLLHVVLIHHGEMVNLEEKNSTCFRWQYRPLCNKKLETWQVYNNSLLRPNCLILLSNLGALGTHIPLTQNPCIFSHWIMGPVQEGTFLHRANTSNWTSTAARGAHLLLLAWFLTPVHHPPFSGK